MTNSTTASAVSPLALVFELNNGSIARALDGLSDDQLQQRGSDRNNSMLWILAHLTQVRSAMLRLLGNPVDTGWGDLFVRGAAIRDDRTYPAKDEILRVHQSVADAIRTTLAGIADEQLASAPARSPVPMVKTNAELIGFFTMHDSYHVGQLSYIRKGLGLPGVAG